MGEKKILGKIEGILGQIFIIKRSGYEKFSRPWELFSCKIINKNPLDHIGWWSLHRNLWNKNLFKIGVVDQYYQN